MKISVFDTHEELDDPKAPGKVPTSFANVFPVGLLLTREAGEEWHPVDLTHISYVSRLSREMEEWMHARFGDGIPKSLWWIVHEEERSLRWSWSIPASVNPKHVYLYFRNM